MKKLIVAAMLAGLLAGCGGRGAGTTSPAIPPPGSTSTVNPPNVPVSSPDGTSSITVNATVGATLQLPYDTAAVTAQAATNSKLRVSGSLTGRRTLSELRSQMAISTVLVSGKLYQGTASARAITNTVSVTPTASGVSIAMPFSNVVVSNNDWIVLTLYAVAADGSQYYLGELGGLVNVATGGTALSIDNASTLRLSAALIGMNRGAISSYDLENTTTLDSDIGTLIASKGYATDPTTLLYGANTRVQIANDMLAKYGRTLAISTGQSGPATVSLVYDYTQTDENNLAYNRGITVSTTPLYNTASSTPGTVGGQVLPGSPEYNTTGIASNVSNGNSPSVSGGAALAAGLVAAYYSAPTGSVVLPVYGGHVLVGAHVLTVQNQTALGVGTFTQLEEPYPFVGGVAAVAGRAVGSSSASVTMASTAVNVTTTDPQLAAFASPAPLPSASAPPNPVQTFTTVSTATSNFGTSFYNGVSGTNGTIQGAGSGAGAVITAKYGGPASVPSPLPTLPPTAGGGNVVPLYYMAITTNQAVTLNANNAMSFIIGTPGSVALQCGSVYYLAAFDSAQGTWNLGTLGPQYGCPAGSNTQFNPQFNWSSPISLATGHTYGVAVYTINPPAPSPAPSPSTAPLPQLQATANCSYTGNVQTCSGQLLTAANAVNGPTYNDTCNAVNAVGCYNATYTVPGNQTGQPLNSFSPPSILPVLVTGATSATVDTWNPFNLSASQIFYCPSNNNNSSQCASFGTTAFTSYTFYNDPGTNLSYYNWQPGTGTTSIASNAFFAPGAAVGTTGGYTVAYGALTGSFSTTTAAKMGANNSRNITSSVPLGTLWTVTVVDTNGNTYTATSPANLQTDGINGSTTALFNLSTITSNLITTQSITYQYQLPAGAPATGTFTVFHL